MSDIMKTDEARAFAFALEHRHVPDMTFAETQRAISQAVALINQLADLADDYRREADDYRREAQEMKR